MPSPTVPVALDGVVGGRQPPPSHPPPSDLCPANPAGLFLRAVWNKQSTQLSLTGAMSNSPCFNGQKQGKRVRFSRLKMVFVVRQCKIW